MLFFACGLPAEGSETISPRELVELRNLSGVSVAPNGLYATVRVDRPSVQDNDVRLEWYRVSLRGSPNATRIADAGEPLLGENGVMEYQTPQWSRDSQWIYYRGLHNQSMQVWRVKFDGSEIERITDDPANISSFVLDPTQDRLLYEVGATREEILHAEKQQYENGIVHDGSLFPGYAVSRAFPWYGRLSMYRRYRDLNGVGGDSHAALLADRPKRILVLSLQTRLTQPAAPQELAQYHYQLESIAGKGRSPPIACGKRPYCTNAGTIFGNDRYGRGRCARSGRDAICVVSRSAAAPRLELVTTEGETRRILFEPNPRLTPDRLGATQRIVLENKYGEEAIAFLVTPRLRLRVPPAPLVLTSYSCDGFLQGGSGDDVPEHILSGFGIVSACLGDNASVSRKADPGAPKPSAQESSLAFRRSLVDLLEKRGLIDSKRVIATGLSYGATSTLYAISHSDLFAAALITSQGYDDPIQAYFYGASDVYRDANASPYLNPAYYGAISPALNADRIRVPLLMLLADTEYLQMMQLYSNLRDLRRPVEMIVYPDEHHIKWQPRHRLAVYEQSVAWIRFWAQGYVETEGEVATMYQRWQKLRPAANQNRELGRAP